MQEPTHDGQFMRLARSHARGRHRRRRPLQGIEPFGANLLPKMPLLPAYWEANLVP